MNFSTCLIQGAWEGSLYTSRGYRIKFSNYDILHSLKIVFILVDSAGPDEMPQYGAFHLGLHCLPKYPIKGFPVYKGLDIPASNLYI